MGTSDVLCSAKVMVLRKPMETEPKSICSSEKWKEGPTTRPLSTRGSGAGWPVSWPMNDSWNSPRASEQKRTW